MRNIVLMVVMGSVGLGPLWSRSASRGPENAPCETQLLEVHGAGVQRSDQKTGDPADYSTRTLSPGSGR